jgi:hypothetical protein
MLVIGKPLAFEICTNISNSELTRITNILKHLGPNWPVFRARTGSRYVESIDPNFIPQDYLFLNEVIHNMLLIANATITDGSHLIPIELFLCYYESGSDICPMHKHCCRQLTLSLGSSRVMKVNSRNVMLNHGDLMYLHGQKHGIPKNSEIQEARFSLNLFFTTSTELQGTS